MIINPSGPELNILDIAFALICRSLSIVSLCLSQHSDFSSIKSTFLIAEICDS